MREWTVSTREQRGFIPEAVSTLEPSRDFVIFVDEDELARKTGVALLREGGSCESAGAASIQEALALMRTAAPEQRVVIVLSAALAASLGTAVSLIAQYEPAPRILLACSCAPACPLGLNGCCGSLGCLEKPTDFVSPSRLLSRVEAGVQGGWKIPGHCVAD